MILMKMSRHIAFIVLCALVFSVASAVAAEFIVTCDDCCGESACDDCITCWCCSAIPAAIAPDGPGVVLNANVELLQLAHHQFTESLCYELLDPPPRS